MQWAGWLVWGLAALMCLQASLCCAWHGKCHMIHYTFSMSWISTQHFQCALHLESCSSVMATLGCAGVSDHPICGVMSRLSFYCNPLMQYSNPAMNQSWASALKISHLIMLSTLLLLNVTWFSGDLLQCCRFNCNKPAVHQLTLSNDQALNMIDSKSHSSGIEQQCLLNK